MTRFTWKRASSSAAALPPRTGSAAGADGWSTDAIGPSRSAPSYPGSSGRRLTARVGVFLRLPLRALGLLVRRVLVRPAAPTVPAAPESLTRIFGGLLLWGFRGLVRGIFVRRERAAALGRGLRWTSRRWRRSRGRRGAGKPGDTQGQTRQAASGQTDREGGEGRGFAHDASSSAAVARRGVFLESVPDVRTTSQLTESPL